MHASVAATVIVVVLVIPYFQVVDRVYARRTIGSAIRWTRGRNRRVADRIETITDQIGRPVSLGGNFGAK